MSTAHFERLREWLIDTIPHSTALGIQIVEMQRGRAILSLPWSAHLVGNADTGVLAGGAITALLDSVSGAAVGSRMIHLVPFATLDLRIDYNRPAEAQRTVLAEAECYRLTPNIAFTRALAHHGDREMPIAAAAGTFMISTRAAPRVTETGTSDRWAGMTILEIIEAARASRDPGKLAEAMPYAAWLGLTPEISQDGLVTRLRYRDKNIGNPILPAIHGGVIGALLETTAIFHLLWEGETVVVPKIVTITVDYLRSARAVDTLAQATLTKQGRRIANVAVEAWQNDRSKPVAAARMHFLLPPPPDRPVQKASP